jgi:hypothetical protein
MEINMKTVQIPLNIRESVCVCVCVHMCMYMHTCMWSVMNGKVCTSTKLMHIDSDEQSEQYLHQKCIEFMWCRYYMYVSVCKWFCTHFTRKDIDLLYVCIVIS